MCLKDCRGPQESSVRRPDTGQRGYVMRCLSVRLRLGCPSLWVATSCRRMAVFVGGVPVVIPSIALTSVALTVVRAGPSRSREGRA